MSSERIPPELITDILHRLPAKSLGQFRCVSKDWLSQISNPQFIKTHQITFNRNHIILISNDNSLYSLPFHNHDKTKLTPTKFQLQELPRADILTIHGSCNGLVLLTADDFDRVHSLIVFNPTTREFVELPKSGFEMVDDLLEIDIMYGFGYDSVSDDFKVVTISYFHYNYLIPPDSMGVHVYSLRTNTWKWVIDSCYDHSYGKSLPGVFVNGFLHWIAKKGSDNLPVIIAFSLANEEFSEVVSPELCDGDCKLVNLGGKLAMFMELKGEIWLMNEYGVRESWMKILINGFNEISMVGRIVFDDNGKIVMVLDDRILVYDVEERCFCKSVDVSWNMKVLKVRGTYVESLLSPKFGWIG